MSRNIILSLATAATVAVAALSSQSADARGFGGGGFGGGRGFGGGGFATARMGGGARMASLSSRGGGRLVPILNPGRGHGGPIHPIFPRHPRPGHGWVFHDHHHGHWVFRGGRWLVTDDEIVDASPVVPFAAPVTPGPCTCLTKTYTHSGLVVFADVCTKESASAPVDATVGDASQAPTTPVAASAVPMSVVPTAPNYAGRTYEDYLAANPQAATPAPDTTQKN